MYAVIEELEQRGEYGQSTHKVQDLGEEVKKVVAPLPIESMCLSKAQDIANFRAGVET